MTKIIRIGIDTSKSVFVLHGVDAAEQPVLRKKLRRSQVLEFFAKLEPTKIGLEACGAAHYWARELMALGHEVVLLPPQYVRPYVKRGRNAVSRSSATIAVICATVFTLPTNATATLFDLPSCAIHSRSAEIAISRPMMIMHSHASARSSQTRTISAATTMSLSATGSRNAPKADVCPQRRASHPSAQSVIAATAKMDMAIQFFAGIDSHEESPLQ